MMRIIQTADWHIGQRPGPTKDGQNLRYADTIRCLEKMVETAKETVPDLVCISGDIFDKEMVGPNRFSQEAIDADRIIKELTECAKHVIVMRGTPNHDGDGIYAVLEVMLGATRNVSVVTKPQVISTPVADIACIPGFDKQEFRAKFPGLSADEENQIWTQEIGRMVMGLKASCDQAKPNILMAHYTVPGCNMESGQTSFFSNFEPVIPRGTLQIADFDAVLLGHIHRPQKLEGLRSAFYSGAVNMLNFNDEGQQRGFYFHDFDGKQLAHSVFVETPFRQFQTLSWERYQVEQYLLKGREYLEEINISELVMDKIVRLKYSCTDDQKKALNTVMLTADLYALGAFYVTEIQPESVITVQNRGLLSEESDPLVNLKRWLTEKCYTDADAIVELAEPIIAQALAVSDKAEVHGVFSPVSIKVKNYRNYKDEEFSFSDISFCTINGVNGAGKSSLFMDAILDALYEEPREGYGNKAAWIRADESARSGSIEFVFDVGQERFRVTRTRVKSRKSTLNLSQYMDGDWQNCSCERIDDTQEKIFSVLGMDSMTFKSCALIMQDQYGLFLQAKGDERIDILGNLLGLEIYKAMEAGANLKRIEARKETAIHKTEVETKQKFIDEKGDPEAELMVLDVWINDTSAELTEMKGKQAKLQAGAEKLAQAKKAADEANAEYLAKDMRRTETVMKKESEERRIEACDGLLAKADYIRDQARQCREYQEVAQAHSARYQEYLGVLKERSDKDRDIGRYTELVAGSVAKAAALEQNANAYRASTNFGEVDEVIEKLLGAREREEDLRKKREQVMALRAQAENAKTKADSDASPLLMKRHAASISLEECRKQEEFLRNSGCVDPDRADCRFLKKAKEDVGRIPALEKEIDELNGAVKEIMDKAAQEVSELEERAGLVEYSDYDYAIAVSMVKELDAAEKKRKDQEAVRTKITALEAEKQAQDTLTAQYQERLTQAISEADALTRKVDELEPVSRAYQDAVRSAEERKGYLKEEAELPTIEERRRASVALRDEYISQLSQIEADLLAIKKREAEAVNEVRTAEAGFNQTELNFLSESVANLEKKLSELQVKKGTLRQKVEDIAQLKAEIAELREQTEAAALRQSRYEILKLAFSRHGVPHQIIRNVIPFITSTANSILGSMTHGMMGVDFKLEQDKRDGGEKAVLDVLIEEYGKTVLPYTSKSGGEKVKASLAVILALAEVKASSAGIKLGMLHIDEAPFLDSDGTEAYVDALEAVRARYPDIKIMAITHDPEFKSRFPQSVTVVKDQDGSHVRWD